MVDQLKWGDEALMLELEWDSDSAVRLRTLSTLDGTDMLFTEQLPLVEILSIGHGHTLASDRLVQTAIGDRLRYGSHEESEKNGWLNLHIHLTATDPHIAVDVHLSSPQGVATLRSSVAVTNLSDTKPLQLQSVTSWASTFGHSAPQAGSPGFDDWQLLSGRSDWLAEGRWIEEPLRGVNFPRLSHHLTGHTPRGELSVVSTGTWSTGKNLPVAAISSLANGAAWLWQIEHNGAWRWEIGENAHDGYFALSGPTDIDHQALETLAPGAAYSSVPVAVAAGPDLPSVIRSMTTYRRRTRRPHVDNTTLGVVFNDYMNTLDGDPTTEKLLPLIDAAAAAGAEIFCIDAGWYDDSGIWWDTVGEWVPSKTRFPGGFDRVIDHIHERRLVPGLWLEPEVIGVRSAIANHLPREAFLLRGGERVTEHDRYHLDLRHPAAIAHLNEVVDRLVTEYGIGFFKLDYNINPGVGTDFEAGGAGAGLLAHNRAHLQWLDSVLDRHPGLILENCASGAMRMDWAILSRLQLQSTSDQQDFLKYPPVTAAAPLSMLPEQAASWAYPQPDMTAEEVAFCLATGLLGRFYLSGYLNRMSDEQRALVVEAVQLNKALRGEIANSTPFWPLGLPNWSSPWVALGLETQTSRYVTIWNRSAETQDVTLRLPDLAGANVLIRTVFPQHLAEWSMRWNTDAGTLHILNTTAVAGARTIELRVSDQSAT